jgi:hypothetical protein
MEDCLCWLTTHIYFSPFSIFAFGFRVLRFHIQSRIATTSN